jgi:hypothetical protein
MVADSFFSVLSRQFSVLQKKLQLGNRLEKRKWKKVGLLFKGDLVQERICFVKFLADFFQ